MQTIHDRKRFQIFTQIRRTKFSFSLDLALPMLLFGCVGAITWAVRGTGGWDGIEGTIIPGLTWALLWYFISENRGIDSRSILLWLGLALAVGGELGYGQYISWIQGRFSIGQPLEIAGQRTVFLPVSKWVGYLWLGICGIGWAGPGGIVLGWVLAKPVSVTKWLARILVPIGFAITGWLLVQKFPALFFPHYTPEFYTDANCPHCARTVYTNTQNFVVLMTWLGALLVAFFHKDKHPLIIGGLLGAGFGTAFAVSAVWCLGYTFAPNYLDWWKMWELMAGFFLGCLYVLALNWSHRQVRPLPGNEEAKLPEGRERRRQLALVLTVALLFYILFYGASYQLGALLGFYETRCTDQYTWPATRLYLFLPLVLAIAAITLYQIRQIFTGFTPKKSGYRLFERISSLIVTITVVGVITIWPSKIGVIYVVLLGGALFALNRLQGSFQRNDQASILQQPVH